MSPPLDAALFDQGMAPTTVVFARTVVDFPDFRSTDKKILESAEGQNSLRASEGIMIAVGCCVPFWAGVIYLIHIFS